MKPPGNIRNIYLLTGLLFFAYVIIRAYSVGVTYDEAWTVRDFVPLKVWDIISYTVVDANNHILNTLLIKFFSLFSDSIFFARLPNVLAFLVFLFFSYRLCSRFLPTLTGFGCFLLLLCNPFVVEFFSLARGYGLALSFLMGSLFFLIRYVKEARPRDVLFTTGCAFFAVASNFALLNFYLSVLVVLFVKWALQPKSAKVPVLFAAAVTGISFALVYEPLRKLQQNGNLYYGGASGFYEDTLVSLAQFSVYQPSYQMEPAIHFILLSFLMLLFGSLIAYMFTRVGKSFVSLVCIAITVLCVLAVILQHHLFGTLYIIDRTALYFYPLLVLSLAFAIGNLTLKVAHGMMGVLVLIFIGNFVVHANIYKTVTWYFDAHTEKVLSLLNDVAMKHETRVTLDYSWPFQSVLEYHVDQGKYPFVHIQKDAVQQGEVSPDFYLYLSSSLDKVGYYAPGQKVVELKKKVVLAFPQEEVALYKLRK